MITLNVKIDVQPTINYLNRVKAGLGDRAIASALNKTVDQSKTQMSQQIRQEYNLTAEFVRSRLVVQHAKASGQRFTATLIGNPQGTSHYALNVIRFLERKVTLAEARRRRKSGSLYELRFQIRRGQTKTIAGAFIGNNGRTVFRRIGKARLPIEAVATVGVPQMFNAKRVRGYVERWIADNFPRIFDHEARYYLSTVK